MGESITIGHASLKMVHICLKVKPEFLQSLENAFIVTNKSSIIKVKGREDYVDLFVFETSFYLNPLFKIPNESHIANVLSFQL